MADAKDRKSDAKAAHKNYKIVVFGSGAVGKSSVTLRFVSNTFTQEYLPTIEDCYRKTLSVDGVVASLDILDTAGQEDFSALRDQWVREGHAFVLVYALNSAQSFREMAAFRERILLVNDEREVNAPIVLLGNKSDLVDERKVTPEEQNKLAAEWGHIPHFECSALDGTGCDAPFLQAIRAVRAIEAKQKPKAKEGNGGGFWSFCTIL